MLTRTEVFNMITLLFKERGLKDMLGYFVWILTHNRCTYQIRHFSIARKDYLQLSLGGNIVAIAVTKRNQKLLSPLIARSTEDL